MRPLPSIRSRSLRGDAELDQELAAQAEERGVAEFNKYVTFALNDKTLTPQEEETLLEFGRLRTTTRSSNVPTFTCNDLDFRIVYECDL